MKIPNFREKGTKLPTLPEGTLLNVVHWTERTSDEKLASFRIGFVSYGHKQKNGFDYILCERPDYVNLNYYMIKESIVIDLWKKENNYTEIYTIQDLANGKCVLNTTGGTYDEVQTVLKAAYPNKVSIYSEGSKYYWTRDAYYWCNGDINTYDLPEQSIQEFLKQIKETKMEKQIIGYKLIKPEFKDAYFAIATVTSLGCATPNADFGINSLAYNCIKEAGVLDLWFAPVYKKVEKVIKMGDAFALRVNSEGIFHGTENITDYVKSIYEWSNTIPTKFGKYDFKVESIILSKTGCESKATLVREWVDVWKEYQELV